VSFRKHENYCIKTTIWHLELIHVQNFATAVVKHEIQTIKIQHHTMARSCHNGRIKITVLTLIHVHTVLSWPEKMKYETKWQIFVKRNLVNESQ